MMATVSHELLSTSTLDKLARTRSKSYGMKYELVESLLILLCCTLMHTNVIFASEIKH